MDTWIANDPDLGDRRGQLKYCFREAGKEPFPGADPRNLEKHVGQTMRGYGARALYKALPVPRLRYDQDWIGPPPPTYCLISGLSSLTTLSQVVTWLNTFGKVETCQNISDPDTAQSLGMFRFKFVGEPHISSQIARRAVNEGKLAIGTDQGIIQFDEDRAIESELVSNEMLRRRMERERQMKKKNEQDRLLVLEKRKRNAQELDDKTQNAYPRKRELQRESPTSQTNLFEAEKAELAEEIKLLQQLDRLTYIHISRDSLPQNKVQLIDVRQRLRAYHWNMLLEDASGFYVGFKDERSCTSCFKETNKGHIYGYPMLMSQHEKGTSLVDAAMRLIFAKLYRNLIANIRRKLLLPSIFAELDSNKHRNFYEHSITLKTGPELHTTEEEEEAPQNIDFTKFNKLAKIKKRVYWPHHENGTTDVTINKRHSELVDDGRKALKGRLSSTAKASCTIAQNRSDNAWPNKTQAPNSTLAFSEENWIRPRSEILDVETPERERSNDIIGLDQPRSSTTTEQMRPVALHSVPVYQDVFPNNGFSLSALQTVIHDDEDWDLLLDVLGLKEDDLKKDHTSLEQAKKFAWLHIQRYNRTSEFFNWKLPQEPSWRINSYERAMPLQNLILEDVSGSETSIQAISLDDGRFRKYKAMDRANRLSNRHLAREINSQHFKSDLFKINHLSNISKCVRFGRSAIHSWGLYAAEPIRKYEMIIEYVGERIRAPLADLRERKYQAMGIGSSYMFRIDEETVVDATMSGGVARFINHCCTPSCTAKTIKCNGIKRIAIYAQRDIAINEEITYDYKFQREEDEDKIPCLCGSTRCRGFLN